MPIADYYDRFDPAKGYDDLLFLASRGLQAAELNDLQKIIAHRLTRIADVLFREGDVVRDGACVVDPDTGAVKMGAGAVYIAGAVRDVPAAAFAIPVNRTVKIGVRMTTAYVTELEDPGLRDPAPGTENFGEPGAARTKRICAWGWDADGAAAAFYPTHTIENGVLVDNTPPPQLDAVTAALALYDRESNGNYVVSGFMLSALGLDGGDQVFVLTEGTANVDGFKTSRATSTRLRYAEDPDLSAVTSEPKTFADQGGGAMRVTVNHAPLSAVTNVVVTKERIVAVNRGGFTGGADALPDTSVLSIVAVNQGGTWNGSAFVGGTTYAANTSYTLTADKVDWAPGGPEPGIGTEYKVVYRYLTAVTPTAVDATGFTVTGAVPGTLVLTDYRWKLPRVDSIAINRDGQVVRIKGLSRPYAVQAPGVPANLLEVAVIEHKWGQTPTVKNTGVKVIPMHELAEMRNQIGSLFDLFAIQQLQTDISIREPASKKGVFADAFRNENQRDPGIVQDAAIVNGQLVLPIDASVNEAGDGATRWALAYTLEPIVEQTLHSGSMKVNPYMAFAPMPARVTLTPPVDFWTEVISTTSETTQRFQSGHFVPGVSRVVSETIVGTSVEIINRGSAEIPNLRQRDIEFRAEGFDPGEALAELTFDGITVTAAA